MLTKRALNHWLRQALPNFEASLAYEMLSFLGPEAAEGITALREKRKPELPAMTIERDLAADLAFALELADVADAITLPYYQQRSFSLDWKANHTEVTEADRETESAISNLVLAKRPGRRLVRRGARRGRQRRFTVAMGDRPDRRHVQLRPRHSGVGDVDRADPPGSRPGRRRRVSAGTRPPVVGSEGTRCIRRRHGRARCRPSSQLDEAQVCVTFSNGWDDAGLTDKLVALLQGAYRARGFGDFWQHMLVAEGAIDLAIDAIGLAPYDLAAVMVVVEEAGGTFTDRHGERTYLNDSAISSNGLLHHHIDSLR